MLDKELEAKLLKTIAKLDRQNDCVGNKAQRWAIDELIVAMRKLVRMDDDEIPTQMIGHK
jgi:hypothetical protein